LRPLRHLAVHTDICLEDLGLNLVTSCCGFSNIEQTAAIIVTQWLTLPSFATIKYHSKYPLLTIACIDFDCHFVSEV
jgi:hypothetical protein